MAYPRTIYRRKYPVRGRRVYRRRTSLYGRYNFGPSYRKKSLMGTKVRDHMAVYHNAFSTASTNAKIPDGKSYNSCGLRLQSVQEWVNSGNIMDFLLFPGCNNGLIASGTVAGPAGNIQPYSNHFKVSPTPFTQIAGGEVMKWRVVSQACRFNLVNNSDENDGWWEAVRVVLPQNIGDEGFQFVDVGGESFVGAAAGDIPTIDTATINMVENPTYISGKLRDIHKCYFDLMPLGSDHDFNECAKVIDDGIAFKALFDNENYDAIFIRIHGRGGTTPTRVMCHVVSNQEILYDETTAMHRFHSESDSHPQEMLETKRRRMNGNHQAAKKNRGLIMSTG